MKDPSQNFARQVQKRADRLQKKRKMSLWQGLGVIGMVGWSVVVPTLLGLALGHWMDGALPTRFSWSLSWMVGGLIFGCASAWYWVDQEWMQLKNEEQDDGSES